MRTLAALLIAITLLAGPAGVGAQEPKPESPPAAAPSPEAPSIEAGSTVSLEYTLRDDDGKVLDSNRGRSPLTYVQGRQQIVPGLERALVGMHVGEEKTVAVAPGDGYGALDPEAVTEVPKELVPAEARVVGTELMARSLEGATRLVRVREVKVETVVIDLNHPLAGKTLHFDVKVVGVQPPAKP
jgi:FKBP-type peptidyl-prolyl cis-trans isomerase SlyD